MGDTSKNNQQQINEDWFSVLQEHHRFSSWRVWDLHKPSNFQTLIGEPLIS